MANNNTFPQDVRFIFEIGSIRHIDRMWHRFMGVPFANNAEHHFRVFWIALLIAQHEQGVDIAKVAKMALLHDIPESRTGDVDYISRQYVERNEDLGMKDMVQGTAFEQELIELWHEYEDRDNPAKASLEAKIVKDADNLDVDFELAEQAANGNRLQELWQSNRQYVADNKLYTQTAKEIFKQLKTADPHAWHNEGRNRRNSGDWRSQPTKK